MTAITFTVLGEPVPQPRPRVSTQGGFARAYVPSTHPVHAYRKAVAMQAKAAGLRDTGDMLDVVIMAAFARPKSHKTKTGLRKGAPALPRPDVDNIAKAVLDALQDVIGDDTHVRQLTIAKRYDDEASTKVAVETVLQNDTAETAAYENP
jgi:Holliday junction resolvase RusA-like endonuclease